MAALIYVEVKGGISQRGRQSKCESVKKGVTQRGRQLNRCQGVVNGRVKVTPNSQVTNSYCLY